MALILSIETSTEICSVALYDYDQLITSVEVHIRQSHASKLAILVDQVLHTADKTTESLQAVAISSGPGSYTGLRIGTSLAKGICFSLNIPLISVGTLELMAHQMKKTFGFSDYLLCPMIDARRMEVYCLLTDGSGTITLPVDARVIDDKSFFDFLENQKIVFFGNGAVKCKSIIEHKNAIFIEGVYPNASALGQLAFHKWKENIFEDLSHYEPFYLKSFVAKKPRALI